MKLCKLGIHKYKFIETISTRCDNCEHLGISCFPEGIDIYKCECGKIKVINAICKICDRNNTKYIIKKYYK